MKNEKVIQYQPPQYLNEEEHNAYIEDFSPLVSEVIEKVVFIADKHNVDRDNAVQHFATIFKAMSEISTFQNWGEPKNPADEHLECSISGDADIQCSMCGEQFTADDIKELAEMGEPFHFCDGKFLCPDCYDSYSRQSLEDQFETALHMGEGE